MARKSWNVPSPSLQSLKIPKYKLNNCTPSIFSGDQALLNSKLLFLKVDQTDIVAFSKSTKKFMKCSTLTDKTAELKCEVGNI